MTPDTPTPAEPNRAFALLLLSEACKSGHEGTIRLAAQLAGVPPCGACGYVVQHCRCAEIAQPATPEPAGLSEWAIGPDGKPEDMGLPTPETIYRGKCPDGDLCLHGCHRNEPCYSAIQVQPATHVALTDEQIDILAYKLLKEGGAFPTIFNTVPAGREFFPFSRALVRAALATQVAFSSSNTLGVPAQAPSGYPSPSAPTIPDAACNGQNGEA